MSNEIELMQGKLRDLLADMRELGQPRSNFALRHFVVGQHDLPGRQRQQVLLELQGLMFELANIQDEISLAKLDIEEMEYQLRNDAHILPFEIERLRIKIAAKHRAIESQSMLLEGRLRECDTLYAMLAEMPTYTREQLEAEEMEYWSKRLPRQFLLAQRDAGGNLNSILEMMTQPGKEKPAMPTSIEQLAQSLGLPDQSLKLLEKK